MPGIRAVSVHADDAVVGYGHGFLVGNRMATCRPWFVPEGAMREQLGDCPALRSLLDPPATGGCIPALRLCSGLPGCDVQTSVSSRPEFLRALAYRSRTQRGRLLRLAAA